MSCPLFDICNVSYSACLVSDFHKECNTYNLISKTIVRIIKEDIAKDIIDNIFKEEYKI